MPPIRRPSDAWPKPLLDEYMRLARLPSDPVELVPGLIDQNSFECKRKTKTFIFDYCHSGQDFAGLLATVSWFKQGPKIVDISEEQFQALSRVEVRLCVKEFTAPFPTILFNMPPGRMHRYVLLHHRQLEGGPVLIGASVSYDHADDIVTVARDNGKHLEATLGKFHAGVTQEEADATHLSLRVACNMALAMSGFGCHREYAFPKEVEQCRKYAAKRGNLRYDDGSTADDRLREQPVILTLDREVKLWRDRRGPSEEGNSTGRVQPFHWVSGHWKMQVHGPNNSLRRRQYVAPYMVHAEALTVDACETTTTYR